MTQNTLDVLIISDYINDLIAAKVNVPVNVAAAINRIYKHDQESSLLINKMANIINTELLPNARHIAIQDFQAINDSLIKAIKYV